MRKRIILVLMCALVVVGAAGTTNRTARGTVCLTFDDRTFDDWVKAIALFKKYNARASFFFSGPIDAAALKAARALAAAGHTVGCHTLTHRDAPVDGPDAEIEAYYLREVKPQRDAFAAAGITVKTLAYPNNRRSDATDRVLAAKGFTRFRAGQRQVRQYRAEGVVDWAGIDAAYLTSAAAARTLAMPAVGCGTIYATTQAAALSGVRRAAERGEVLCVFSHAIRPGATGIHMPSEWLEAILEEGTKRGVAFIGLDELH